MEGLFDPSPYEIPVEMMGERPPMTAQEWLEIADEMHQTGQDNAAEEALRKHEAARQREGTTQFLGGLSLF